MVVLGRHDDERVRRTDALAERVGVARAVERGRDRQVHEVDDVEPEAPVRLDALPGPAGDDGREPLGADAADDEGE